MKLIDLLDDEQIDLLQRLNIVITNKEYGFEEIYKISDLVVEKGETRNLKKDPKLASKYVVLADFLIDLGMEEENKKEE